MLVTVELFCKVGSANITRVIAFLVVNTANMLLKMIPSLKGGGTLWTRETSPLIVD